MSNTSNEGTNDHVHHVLASRIRAARINSGLSQTELAKLLDVNRATVGHWEREDGFTPSIDHLRAIDHVLHIGLDWLGPLRPANGVPVGQGSRAKLELRMIELSKNLPASFLACLIALMENAEMHL